MRTVVSLIVVLVALIVLLRMRADKVAADAKLEADRAAALASVPSPRPRRPTPTPMPDEFASARESLLTIEGKRLKASGFVGAYQGQSFAFTNAHVLSDNPQFQIRRLNNEQLPQDDMAIADGFDVAAFRLKGDLKGLPIAEHVDEIATIGDSVVILGNSLGAGVVTELRGRITGIGPRFIEVDAPFVAGNSGSPVIHVKSRKVIGLATLTIYREFTTFGRDSKYNGVERRFAQRLDTISKFQPTTPAKFQAESEVIARLSSHTEDLIRLGFDMFDDGRVTLTPHQQTSNRLAPIVRDFLNQVAKARSEPDQAIARGRLARELVHQARSGLGEVNVAALSSFHRERFEEEARLREKIREAFAEISGVANAPALR